mmetsp:Transcript_46123/g.98543  ORF Transcript_46123/g.98543 Transcript_46123/m.98543 type:complete len:326 (-) Transcript_46123:26-1003(-)
MCNGTASPSGPISFESLMMIIAFSWSCHDPAKLSSHLLALLHATPHPVAASSKSSSTAPLATSSAGAFLRRADRCLDSLPLVPAGASVLPRSAAFDLLALLATSCTQFGGGPLLSKRFDCCRNLSAYHCNASWISRSFCLSSSSLCSSLRALGSSRSRIQVAPSPQARRPSLVKLPSMVAPSRWQKQLLPLTICTDSLLPSGQMNLEFLITTNFPAGSLHAPSKPSSPLSLGLTRPSNLCASRLSSALAPATLALLRCQCDPSFQIRPSRVTRPSRTSSPSLNEHLLGLLILRSTVKPSGPIILESFTSITVPSESTKVALKCLW